MNEPSRMKQGISLIIVLAFLIIVAGCTGTAPTPGSPTTASPVPTGTTVAASAFPALTALRPPSTTLEIKEYVDTAATWAQQHGKEVALAAFNNASGPFVNGDLYVYALDYAGTGLALPFQPKMVGANFTPIKDASGKPYTEIEIKLAQANGGYILYHYPYPVGNQTSTLKISYVRPVDTTYWIGAGLYTTEDRVVDQRLRQFVANATSYARANGRSAALAAFNNTTGQFVDGELYIFAYDYNGTVLAWLNRPDQHGMNRWNATDPMGTYHVQEMIATAKAGGGMVDYYSTNPLTNRTDLKISYVTDVDGTWLIGAGRYIVPGSILLRA